MMTRYLVSTDLEQAESRDVAGEAWRVTGKRNYWDACLSSDLHTQAVRMAYPEFPWTGDPKAGSRPSRPPLPYHPQVHLPGRSQAHRPRVQQWRHPPRHLRGRRCPRLHSGRLPNPLWLPRLPRIRVA